jgi:hypothetical protein
MDATITRVGRKRFHEIDDIDIARERKDNNRFGDTYLLAYICSFFPRDENFSMSISIPYIQE